jgi:uncharacterized membrane protein YhaH (DUF805 family)
MSDTWYYADQGQRVGPVPSQDLKAALTRMANGREVLVWRDGFPDWKRAGDVPELWSQPLAGAYAAPPVLGPAPAHGGAKAASFDDPKHLWFGFDGRINRAKWWLVNLINIVALSVVAGIVFGVFGFSLLGGLLFGVFYLVLLFSAVAICAKRLHDRNKSAWWAALFIGVPVLLGLPAQVLGESGLTMVLALVQFGIAVWAFVELGCLRGTVGPNQYGADPLEGRT